MSASSTRHVRIGPLNIQLHYTWLLMAVLGLWWLALLWLPDNFPDWPGALYWLVAGAVILLFFLSVVAHELVHSTVSRTGTRNITLFPFGAVMPYRLSDLAPERALSSAIAGPVFNLALGWLLIFVGGFITGTDDLAGGVKATATALGTANLWLGLINLIPGVPFDGGWLLSAAITWFGLDSETALRVGRALGRLASLALVLMGAWLGLTSDQWLPALTLVLLGWAAREAGAIGKHRGLLLGAFNQMHAREFMQAASTTAAVRTTDTVADMVRNHPRLEPGTPLPVLDETGAIVGIVAIGAAESLLQGTWPSTPVTALMTQRANVEAVRPDTVLTRIIQVADARRGSPQEESYIPVIENGVLLGSINPDRLNAFKQVEEEFGIDSSSKPATRGLLGRIGPVLPVAMVIAAMAVLGNLGLRTDPAELRDLTSGNTEASVTFTNITPADSSFLGLGAAQISVEMQSARPISDAVILLDDTPLDTQLSGASPLTQTATAQTPGLLLGQHHVSITATTKSGRTKSINWAFRVGSAGDAQAGGAQSTATGVAAPPGQPLEIVRYIPTVGGRVLAGSTNVPLSVQVQSSGAPAGVQMYLDGVALNGHVTPVEGSEGRYSIEATALRVQAGIHRVRADIQSTDGKSMTSEWTFQALRPSENTAYFKETGHFLAQPFLGYWQDHGGLTIFGYPISERIQETDKQSGETYAALYFERARFELHAATGDQVILGRLGAILHPPAPPAIAKDGAQFFPETGHNVSGDILKYWNENGGLSLFGYPISEEVKETSPIDGKEYTVQYFERARFELHPEQAGTSYVVQLGQLGRQLYEQKYGK